MFQIYFDFSGYSDMAIGLGKIIGFDFKENFNYPYTARSITDFWRRWHISLGAFFRDYVYIPLGGNRKNAVFNILFVWMVTGLWHGASFNFIMWGLYFGILLIIEKYFLRSFLERIPRIFSHIYCLFIVFYGWLIFYFTDLGSLLGASAAFFGFSELFADYRSVEVLFANLWILPIFAIFCTRVPIRLFNYFAEKWTFSEPLVNFTIVVASFVLMIGQTFSPFIYFRF